MNFSRFLIYAGVVLAICGLLILVFEATMFFIFGEWYGFSTLDILQRIGVRDYLYTHVNGFDNAVDWLLNFPLPFMLIAAGCLIGFIGYQELRSEKKWYRP